MKKYLGYEYEISNVCETRVVFTGLAREVLIPCYSVNGKVYKNLNSEKSVIEFISKKFLEEKHEKTKHEKIHTGEMSRVYECE